MVVAPAVPPLPWRFRAAAQDVLQGAPLLAQLALGSIDQAPGVQVGRAWEGVVNRLDEKLDARRFSFPELSPGDIAGFCVLPPSPCP